MSAIITSAEPPEKTLRGVSRVRVGSAIVELQQLARDCDDAGEDDVALRCREFARALEDFQRTIPRSAPPLPSVPPGVGV
jgi:hypothetical protein